MATFQLSPGVQVTEKDLTNIVPAVSTTAGGFAGTFQWGPVEDVTTVDSEKSLVEIFGKPDNDTFLSFFTAANFLSYGNNLNTVRVVGDAARNAVAATSGSIESITMDELGLDYGAIPTVIFSDPELQDGVPAQGTAVFSGRVSQIDVVNGGTGYTVAPTVTITGDGTGAVATALISGSVTGINLTNSGSLYTAAPTVTITGSGIGATATAQINGSVDTITITAPGTGYTSAPKVTFSMPELNSGVPATGIATFDAVVDSVVITNGGSGYTIPPTVIFDSVSGIGTGVTGVATIEGNVPAAVVTNGGSGYTTPPTVTITGANTTAASAIANISGPVQTITLVDGGTGYTSAPTVLITAGGGAGATATAVIDGRVQTVTMGNFGSSFTVNPVVTFSAPAAGGTTATATLTSKVSAFVVNAGGAGYAVGDTIDVDFGAGVGTKATLVVDTVDGAGAVLAATLTAPGAYTTIPGATALTTTATSGTGTGLLIDATYSLVSIALTSPGSMYQSAPTVTIGGVVGATATSTILGSVSAVNVVLGGAGYTQAPAVSISAPASGTTASATATISGSVTSITITNVGAGYTAQPTITLSAPPAGGTLATATPVFNGSVTGVTITAPGTGYTTPPGVRFGAPNLVGGVQATGAATITGQVTGVTLVNPGSGYTTPPTITFTGGGGTGAAAVPTILGPVAHVILTSGGSGYTTTPTLTISAPTTAGGVQAVAAPIFSARVVGIVVNQGGSGYTTEPTITLTAPSGVNGVQATAESKILGTVTDITITNFGTGYQNPPTISFVNQFGYPVPVQEAIAFATLDSVAPDAYIIKNRDEYTFAYANGKAQPILWAAKFPGVLGNSIKVAMCDSATWAAWPASYRSQFDAAPATSDYGRQHNGQNDEMHILVIDEDGLWTGVRGTVLEKYQFVSKAFDAKRNDGSASFYKEVINQSSRYVWWINHTLDVNDGTEFGASMQDANFCSLLNPVNISFIGGVSDDVLTDSNAIAGFSLLENDEKYDVSLIPTGGASGVVATYVINNVVESRKDCVAFISPPLETVVNNPNQEAEDIVTFRETLPSSSYAVMDSGYKYQYDRYNDVYRWIPLNGDVAGLCARTDFVADPWFSPGGFNRGQVKNVVKLAYSPRKTDRDTLYKKGVNPVVSFPGQGTVLYGDKTLLARPSAFDRINVRRLFIVLEKAIATASKYQLFEFNDAFTRAQFKNIVEPFLRDVHGRRGITDFRVVCDETNNTGEVIDRNEFVADIYIKPARSINFINLNFVAVRTGVSFDEVGA